MGGATGTLQKRNTTNRKKKKPQISPKLKQKKCPDDVHFFFLEGVISRVSPSGGCKWGGDALSSPGALTWCGAALSTGGDVEAAAGEPQGRAAHVDQVRARAVPFARGGGGAPPVLPEMFAGWQSSPIPTGLGRFKDPPGCPRHPPALMPAPPLPGQQPTQSWAVQGDFPNVSRPFAPTQPGPPPKLTPDPSTPPLTGPGNSLRRRLAVARWRHLRLKKAPGSSPSSRARHEGGEGVGPTPPPSPRLSLRLSGAVRVTDLRLSFCLQKSGSFWEKFAKVPKIFRHKAKY